ncbi:MAG: hypothetical protein IBV53_04225 [Candidatus Atribacteria bacterium]
MVARLTAHDLKTVAKVIKEVETGKKYPTKKPHPRILDPCREQIMEWIEEGLTRVSWNTRQLLIQCKVFWIFYLDIFRFFR